MGALTDEESAGSDLIWGSTILLNAAGTGRLVWVFRWLATGDESLAEMDLGFFMTLVIED